MPSTLDFITRVLPWGTGLCNLHWKIKDRPGMPGRSFTRPEDLLARATTIPVPADIYFCLSTQSVANERRKTNAVAFKAIWVEVDGNKPDKPEKGYATKMDAIAATDNFLRMAKLAPPSAIVDSGGGYHVYWISDKTLTPEEWIQYATGLYAAAQKYGLKCDPVTTDYVRVLRVPDTFNYKTDPPKPVRLVALQEIDYDFKSTLYHIKDIHGPVSHIKQSTTLQICNESQFPKQDYPIGEGTIGLQSYTDEPLALGPLLDVGGCPHLVDACLSHGARYGQPLWHLDVLLATFLESGRKMAHYMSDGYKGYSAEETDRMWDRKVNEREERGLGWPSCVALEAAGCKSCQACPHRGKIRSPLNLTQAVEVATPFLPISANAETATSGEKPPFDPNPQQLPRDYKIDKDGLLCHKVKVSLGQGVSVDKWEPFTLRKWWDPYVTGNPLSLNFMSDTSLGEVGEIVVTNEMLSDSRTLVKAVHKQETLTVTGKDEVVLDFTKWWMKTVSDRWAALKSHPYGWVINEGGQVAGFVYGGNMYKCDGTEQRLGYGDELLKKFKTYGEEEAWYKALDLVTQQTRPELEVLVAASFASPLLRITGKYGGMVSGYSRSGGNKSTAVDIGNAVWGNPKLIKGSPSASLKFLMNQMATTHNLPLYWDDVKEQKKLEQVAEFASVAAEGQEGGKLTSARGIAKTGDWQSLLIVCANKSIIDVMLKQSKTDAASLYRVFEFPVNMPQDGDAGRMSDTIAGPIIGQLEYNYGHMGKLFAQWLGSQPDQIEKITLDFTKQFEDMVKPQPGERFWVSICGTIYAGAWCANELGANFNLDRMWKFLEQTFYDLRERVSSENLEGGSFDNTEAYLTGFFKEQGGSTAITRDMCKQGKSHSLRLIDIPDSMHNPNAHINVHWVVEDKLLRIARTPFDKYLASIPGTSPAMVYKGLKDHFEMEHKFADLAAGLPKIIGGREKILRIPIKPGTWLYDELMSKVPKSQES